MMLFIYDAAGSPVGFRYRNSDTTKFAVGQFSTYIYGKNVEGDVIYIFNSSGTKVAEYTYDAWGNVTVAYISQDPGPGVKDNPFRYRGYYYDEETGWYYLQSRYYNPEWGRFISPDSYLNANGDLIGFNLYAYCSNEPVKNTDPTGRSPWTPYLTIIDYHLIHDMVAKDAARKINILARNEVFVRGTKGCGRLDIYDCLSNSYYEVKSEGAAFTNSTNKQMEKYDNAHVLFSSRGNVKRGTKIVSGTFYYGAWKITYQSVANGLISYSCTWSQQRYETAKMIALTSVAIICITALTIASDGAAAPLYTAIPLCIG